MLTVKYTAQKCIFTPMQRCSFTIPREVSAPRLVYIYIEDEKKNRTLQYNIIIIITIIIRIRRGGAVSVKLQQLPCPCIPLPPHRRRNENVWSFMRGGCVFTIRSFALSHRHRSVLQKSGFYVIVSVFFWNKLDFGRFMRRFSRAWLSSALTPSLPKTVRVQFENDTGICGTYLRQHYFTIVVIHVYV